MKNVPRQGYQLMSLLPGKIGSFFLRKYSESRREEVRADFEVALEKARGELCIDLGANLGGYSLRMANVASRVIAFEPDPWAASELRMALSECDNVEVIEAAAGTFDGRMPFFRSENFEKNPHIYSLSSSLLPEKKNVGFGNKQYVDVIDFTRFVDELDSNIALLKIDIEGGEVALLEELLGHSALNKIRHIFVETHETKVPSISKRSRSLRRRVRKIECPKIEMDWL